MVFGSNLYFRCVHRGSDPRTHYHRGQCDRHRCGRALESSHSSGFSAFLAAREIRCGQARSPCDAVDRDHLRRTIQRNLHRQRSGFRSCRRLIRVCACAPHDHAGESRWRPAG